MALNGLICADVPLSNYSLTHVAADIPRLNKCHLGNQSSVT